MQIDKTVTIYFDISCNVIFHWFAYHTEKEVFIAEENNSNNREKLQKRQKRGFRGKS